MDGVNWKPEITMSETGKQIDKRANDPEDAIRLTCQMQRGKNQPCSYYSLPKVPGLRVSWLRNFQKDGLSNKGLRADDMVRSSDMFSYISLLLPPRNESKLTTWKRKNKQKKQ